MAKTYIDTVKYLVYTNVEIDGIVEKPDVVGAIFGQTEGLLGDELDLRDLQKNGRIGRIEVDLLAKEGKTAGTIKIPSSLDMVETCIIAAALETVDRVGPCEAKLSIGKIEDTRNVKRKSMVERAKSLLKNLLNTEIPESKEISDMVREEVKVAEITEYGYDRLPAGPGIDKSEEAVFVEGRADVINLLKNDITNVIGIGGAKITRTIVELSKKKEVTLFLDGDRGGDIILNELIQSGVEIDFVARAPTGMEVEELTRKEMIKYLRNRMPFEQANSNKKASPERRRADVQRFREERQGVIPSTPVVHDKEVKIYQEYQETNVGRGMDSDPNSPPSFSLPSPVVAVSKEELMAELEGLTNTLKARFYNNNYERIAEVPVRDVIKSLSEAKEVNAIVFDGIITQRLADLASKQGVKILVGLKIGNVTKSPENIEIITKIR